MWAVTGWCLLTWVRITVALSVIVGVLWLTVGTDDRWFWAAAVGAAFLELYAIRQLAREWTFEARSCWWWAP